MPFALFVVAWGIWLFYFVVVGVESDGQFVTNSLLVAEKFGKEHRNVIRDIRNLLEKDVLKIEQMFVKSTVKMNSL
jgi:phage regulator Rha-like protein